MRKANFQDGRVYSFLEGTDLFLIAIKKIGGFMFYKWDDYMARRPPTYYYDGGSIVNRLESNTPFCRVEDLRPTKTYVRGEKHDKS
jgi:hypothetical protein